MASKEQISLRTSDFRIRLRNVLKKPELTWNSKLKGLNRTHLQQYAKSYRMASGTYLKHMSRAQLIRLIKDHNKSTHEANIGDVLSDPNFAGIIGSYTKLTSNQEANLKDGPPSTLFNRPHTGPMGPVNKTLSTQIHSKWHQVIRDDDFETINYQTLFQRKASESQGHYTKRVKISAWALINHRIDIFIRILRQDQYGTSSSNATATIPINKSRIIPHIIIDDIRCMGRAMELATTRQDAFLIFAVASDRLKESREFQKHSTAHIYKHRYIDHRTGRTLD